MDEAYLPESTHPEAILRLHRFAKKRGELNKRRASPDIQKPWRKPSRLFLRAVLSDARMVLAQCAINLPSLSKRYEYRPSLT